MESGLGLARDGVRHSHGHTLVWAVVPKGPSLLFEDDEIPHSQERVFRHMEMEELGAGKGAEGTQLAG